MTKSIGHLSFSILITQEIVILLTLKIQSPLEKMYLVQLLKIIASLADIEINNY